MVAGTLRKRLIGPPAIVIRWSLLLALVVGPLGASDWPQWRGPERDGSASAEGLPAQLPKQLRQLWQVEVGTGHSSPVVVGERVYQFSREDEAEVMRALDLSDGGEIWSTRVPTSYRRNPAAFFHGKGPKSTPVVHGQTVCTLGIAGRLSCHDRDTGELRWAHEFSDRFTGTSPDFGSAMSPAVMGGRLIAHVGGDEAGSLSAFDLESGKEIWSWTGEGPAYASPIQVVIGGVEQLVTQSRTKIISVATETGQLLWQTPLVTDHFQNAITPVALGSTLIFSGLDRPVFAAEVQPDGRGNWLVRKRWQNDDFPMYMSTPVVGGGLLFGFTHRNKGQLVCLDAASGEVKWTSEGRQGDNASLIIAGDRLIVLTTESNLMIGPTSDDGWAPEASYEVADSPTWAHPAFLGERILIKDETRLAAWSFTE